MSDPAKMRNATMRTAWVPTAVEDATPMVIAQAAARRALEMAEKAAVEMRMHAGMHEHWREVAERWRTWADRSANVAIQQAAIYANEVADRRRVSVASHLASNTASCAAPRSTVRLPSATGENIRGGEQRQRPRRAEDRMTMGCVSSAVGGVIAAGEKRETPDEAAHQRDRKTA